LRSRKDTSHLLAENVAASRLGFRRDRLRKSQEVERATRKRA
jgi:hypothetical protein